MKGYTHLQPSELCKISALAALNLSSAAIAAELKRHPATIRRERARCAGSYDEQTALSHRSAARRRCASNAQRWQDEHWQRVEQGLCRHHSPEQILGRAWVLDEPPLPSCSRIYTWLAEVERKDTDFFHGKRVRRYGSREDRARRHAPSHWAARATPIAERPEPINVRAEFGHWEIDTVEGRKSDSPRVLVVTERMSLLTRLAFIPRNTAAAVLSGLQRLRGRRRSLFLSLTPDQGSEFAHLERFLPNSRIFACDPHSPWQKGLVENTNGLLRFYVPKGYPISHLSPEYVQYVEDLLNDRPRKSLDWLTPRELASLLHSACAL
jgi:transposase, IS30 family